MAMLTAVRTILLALILAPPRLPAGADDLADFAVAVERAELQYRIALRTLESAGRDQTAAEVRLFRAGAGRTSSRGSTTTVRRNSKATTPMPRR